jgi:tetratricopeptide (TPR) repeat protein
MPDVARLAAALQAARLSVAQQRLDEAREQCGQILLASPDDPGALHLLGVMAVREGAPREAADYLRRAAQSPGANALYLLSYAEFCLKATDPAAALAMTRRALALDGNLALGWFSLGSQLLEMNDYAESERCFDRTLELEPGFWRARAQSAVVLARRGDTAQALERFRGLLSEQPDNVDAIAHYAGFLQDIGQTREALIHIERAIARAPDSLDHHMRAADIEMQLGRHAAALQRLRGVEQRWGDNPQFLAFEATLLRLLDRYEEALALCRGALARGIESTDLLRAYGLALHLAGDDEEAFRMLDRAAEQRPALALGDKAVLLSQLGRLSEACATFDEALSHEPGRADAWYNKSNAKNFTRHDPDMAAMQRLIDAGCHHRDRLLLHFALGKAHGDLEDFDAAFAHWHEGNRMKRALLDYDPDEAARHMESIAAMSSTAGGPREIADDLLGEFAVFVVGMPRSGSSLVEQIIASHPQVHGGGEQMRLRELFAANVLDPGPHRDDDRIARSAAVRARRFSRSPRIVDKDLANFKYLGIIHRVFPRARIIHCRRDPLDTCFSAYTKLFLGDFPFAYDLRELGLYYRAYRSLMDHWSRVLPSRSFIEVDYETLVSDPIETTRRLVDFLDLPWSEACVRFHETDRAVNTASLAQVRRPIYRSSVGRAAPLLAHLAPLVEALRDTPVP